MDLLSQEPKIIRREEDFFNFHGIIESLHAIIKKKEGMEQKNPVIGLFGQYGEGKSSLLKTFKEKYKGEYCCIHVDLWQYETSEIRYDFHKIYQAKKGNHYRSSKLVNTVSNVANTVGFKDVPQFLTPKRGFEHQFYTSYFERPNMARDIEKQRQSFCSDAKTTLLIVENLDRLTKEDKVFTLSTLYNNREFIQLPMIIALDPNSVQEDKKYFENLIKKVFSTFISMPNKTKTLLKEFIENELKTIAHGESSQRTLLSDMLLTQYPLTLRSIKHIINLFEIILHTSDVSSPQYIIAMFSAILQSEYPSLHLAISKNPFYIEGFKNHSANINSNFYERFAITEENAYKLNRLFRTLSDSEIMKKEVIQIVSPLFDLKEKEINHYREKNYFEILKNDHKLKIIIELLNQINDEHKIIEILLTLIQDKEHIHHKKQIMELYIEAIQKQETLILFFVHSNYKPFSIFIKKIVPDPSLLYKLINIVLNHHYTDSQSILIMKNVYDFVKTMYLSNSEIHQESFNWFLIHLSLENRHFFEAFMEDKENFIEEKGNNFQTIFLNVRVYAHIEHLGTANKLYYFSKILEKYNNQRDANQDNEAIVGHLPSFFEEIFLNTLLSNDETNRIYEALFTNSYVTLTQSLQFTHSLYYNTKIDTRQKLTFLRIIINKFFNLPFDNDTEKVAIVEIAHTFVSLLHSDAKESVFNMDENLETLKKSIPMEFFDLELYDTMIKKILLEIITQHDFLSTKTLQHIKSLQNHERLKKSEKFNEKMEQLYVNLMD